LTDTVHLGTTVVPLSAPARPPWRGPGGTLGMPSSTGSGAYLMARVADIVAEIADWRRLAPHDEQVVVTAALRASPRRRAPRSPGGSGYLPKR
jgi:hypothetical protein